MKIRKAERKSVKIKLAISGLTGSGKTMGAILLARGLSDDGKILIIDTENQSACLYSDHPVTKHIGYDVLDIDAPFTVDKYLRALQLGVDAGYSVIVIDSISHQWDAEGGSLDKKNKLDLNGGNSFTNWGGIKREANTFQSKLLSAPVHIIVTMRSKMEYVLETNEKGKQAPRKIGLAPIQKDGIEYEFTTVFDMSIDKTYSITKDRTGLFDGRIEKLSEKTGKEIRDWLCNGKAVEVVEPQAEVEIDAPSIHRSVIMIKSQNDMLAAVEFWGGITASEKEAVKKLMTPGEISWFKQAWEGRPKEASQAVNTQYPLHS